MSRRPDAAARAAMALFSDAPRADRAHVRGRWWTAPFPAVEAELPPSGRVLEIGCGHGLFVAYAALRAPGRQVVGVDIDTDKIAVGAKALAPLGDLAQVGIGRSWAAIVLLHVLYIGPGVEQRALLVESVRQLADGGVILVKEMATEPSWKTRWNSFQETLAVKVLRITEGGNFTFVSPDTMADWLREEGLSVDVRPLDRGHLHPHVLVRGERTTTVAGTAG